MSPALEIAFSLFLGIKLYSGHGIELAIASQMATFPGGHFLFILSLAHTPRPKDLRKCHTFPRMKTRTRARKPLRSEGNANVLLFLHLFLSQVANFLRFT